jgi:hypothetical protein
MANLVHNERAKLVANALDRASTACFTTGVLAPTVAVMLGQSTVALDYLCAAVGFWSVPGLIFHVEARRAITTLKE